ncbi:MAG TPA: G1 family glutamic endopeptidase [Gaiellaceae bacterium]
MRRISFAFAVAAVVAAAVPAFAAGSPASGLRFDPNHKITNSTSSNWSGYATTGARFVSITSSWTEPTALCGAGETSYSSFWVGLDGDTSGTVEQTGTDADCSSGVARYYAWYEMYPKFPTNLSNPVQPGDTLTASVTTDGVGRFTLAISSSRGWQFSTTQRLKSASLASAEVIAEAPSSRSGVLPLTNFGAVNFGPSTANNASLATAPNLDPITMATSSGTPKAQPGNIASNGSFTVTWKNH